MAPMFILGLLSFLGYKIDGLYEKPEVNSINRDIFSYGLPGNESFMTKNGYLLSYNNALRIPNWGYELLDSSMALHGSVDHHCHFRVDAELDSEFQSHNQDYSGSGYERGHIVPAGDYGHEKYGCNTYFYSNVCPQVGPFNEGLWNAIETKVRGYRSVCERVFVATGPAFIPTKNDGPKVSLTMTFIGENLVAVPTHLFKSVLCECKSKVLKSVSYLAAMNTVNQTQPVQNFVVKKDDIETHVGLKFFPMAEKIEEQDYADFNC